MSENTNALGLPIGFPVPHWHPCERPPQTAMEGTFCRVEPIDPQAHAADLYEANATDAEDRMWAYLPYGPFDGFEAYRNWMDATCTGNDPMFHAIVDRTSGKAIGVASLMRIDPLSGCIEVGHIAYSPRLQRTPAATEAMFLMMSRVFEDLGYRRYEWKCDSLNSGSCGAATRLGFTFEGTFRQAAIYKGRNRDTSWFSIVDDEWPAIRDAFQRWLDPGNFDEAGLQRQTLRDLITATRALSRQR